MPSGSGKSAINPVFCLPIRLAACIVRVRQTRYRIDPNTIYEKLIPDDLREVRALPFPPWFPREIQIRTQHERVWRRLRFYPTVVGEIG